jgi:WD40 repeat protein
MYTARPTEEWWRPEKFEEEDDEAERRHYERNSKYFGFTAMKDEEDEDSDDFNDESDEDVDIDDDDADAPPQFHEDWRIKQSLLSIRSLAALPESSNHMVSVTRDGSLGLLDIELGKLTLSVENANECGYEVAEAWDDNLIICGDEDGAISGYDLRMHNRKPVYTTKPKAPAGEKVSAKGKGKKNKLSAKFPHMINTENVGNIVLNPHDYGLGRYWFNDDHADYITDIALARSKGHVAFTSADAHLSVWDARKGDFADMSGRDDDELMSCCYLKEDSALLCGTDAGPLSLYNTSDISTYIARYKVHGCGVDHLLKLDDSTVVSAAEDGIMRVIMIKPSRAIGVVGAHTDFVTGMDRLRPAYATDLDDYIWSSDIIGSCSHDSTVRFWNIQDMQMLRRTRTKKELNELKKYNNKRLNRKDAGKDSDSDDEFDDFGDNFESEDDTRPAAAADDDEDADEDGEEDEDADFGDSSDDEDEEPSDEAKTKMASAFASFPSVSQTAMFDFSQKAAPAAAVVEGDSSDEVPMDEDDDDDEDEDDDDAGVVYKRKLIQSGDDTDALSSGSEVEHDDDSDFGDFGDDDVLTEGADAKTVAPAKKQRTSEKSSDVSVSLSSRGKAGADSDSDEEEEEEEAAPAPAKGKDKGSAKVDAKDKKKKKKKRVLGHGMAEAALTESIFSADKFRNKHKHALAHAHETDKAKRRQEKEKLQTDIAKAKAANARVQPLPDIQRKMPVAKKVKHGAKNFFNGL